MGDAWEEAGEDEIVRAVTEVLEGEGTPMSLDELTLPVAMLLELEKMQRDGIVIRLRDGRWRLMEHVCEFQDGAGTACTRRRGHGGQHRDGTTDEQREDDLMPRDDYQERQDERRERLEGRAEAADAKADQLRGATPDSVRHDWAFITQPGHIPERARMIKRDERAHEERQKAAHLRGRAASVGKGGISSDDPEAISKLEAKITRAESEREGMKAINAAWRKAGKPEADDSVKWLDIAVALGVGLDDLQRVRLDFARFHYHGQPIPGYALSNLGANIRRMKKRVEELRAEHERQAAMEAQADDGRTSETQWQLAAGPGIEAMERPDINRVAVVFDERPSRDVTRLMRSRGFRWNRTEVAWTRMLNDSGRYAAKDVVEHIIEEGML